MVVIFRQAAIYTAIVFAFAFLLGMVRVLFVVPLTGEIVAVLIEIPVMLAFAWVVGAYLFRDGRFTIPQGIEIGLASFLLLQITEGVASGVLGPFTFTDNVLSYFGAMSTAKLIGLAGQMLFALVPLIQIMRTPRLDP